MTRRHAIPLAAAVAVAVALAWLARPADTAPVAGPGGSVLPQRSGSATSQQLLAATSPLPKAADAGREGDFLTPDLRFRLEALLLDAGEAPTPEELKRRLVTLAARHFTERDAARGLALAQRYVDYRVALGATKPPADPGDPRALRDAVDARQRIRAQHFTGEEARTLFAQEEELDRYTLARLEVERNPQLTPAQKTDALRDAERELSEGQRAWRAEAVAHAAVAAQTATFDAAQVSEHQRFAQRSAHYGEATAQRLAQLDRDERDWQWRLDMYAAAAGRNPAAQDLQQLRQQLFTTEEQMRIEAALALREMAAPAKSSPR